MQGLFADLLLQMDIQIVGFLKLLGEALAGHQEKGDNIDDGDNTAETELQVDIAVGDDALFTENVEESSGYSGKPCKPKQMLFQHGMV